MPNKYLLSPLRLLLLLIISFAIPNIALAAFANKTMVNGLENDFVANDFVSGSTV